jgi:zinc D-Ala-D-Ala carboxypeptidase
MKLSENFTMAEFIKSDTAKREGIDNTPEGEHLENAKALFENVVQKVRDHFGPTVLNSGYRCPELNQAVRGSKTSQHCKGEAADIEVRGVANGDLAQWIVDNLDFDQVILEFYTPGEPSSGWVHVSYKADGTNRKSILTASRIDGKTVYTNGINA